MMKRVLSLLLCLIMVCGIAVPGVQASETNDVFVADDMSNFITGAASDNVVFENVTVDGNNVGPAPNPTQLQAEAAQDVTSPVFAESAEVAVDSACPCDEYTTIAEHKSDCAVKVKYHKLCGSLVEDLFAVWGDYTAEEQAYMLQYMQENYSGRYAELMKLINAPTGSAIETCTDGTTVSVEGIPEDGTLTVKEATNEVKDIVSDYMAEQESNDNATALFTYDVSVQDGEGSDWQPEETVKMELEVPGTRLHKYSKVYVVHVDDNGEASTIEAEVTEDGKIAFETPGFSTFAGFTVDFEYNGEGFSIKGLSEILVSEMMDRLKMPLYIEDVADVTFTDETLVSVTAQEGDWLLTSLKAFDTDEQLTLTMKDGTQYVIRVTDAQFATTAKIYVGGTQADTDGNGECTWYLSGDSDEVGYAYFGHNWDTAYGGSYADGWSSSSVIEIRGPGTFQINLQHQQKSDAYDRAYWGGDSCALRVNVRQIKITSGAKLVFRMGSYFSGSESSVTIRGTGDCPIFDIQDGSLYFRVSSSNEIALPAGAAASYFGRDDSDGYIPVHLDGNDKATSATSPLIYSHRGTDADDRMNLVVEDVNFKNAKHRAILVQTNNMTNLCLKGCSFPSTVRSVSYGGGAIYVDGATDGSSSNVVDVKNFILENCTFNGNTGASGHGGAIASYGDIYKLYVNGCTFKNCTSANRAGAIELSVNDKTKSNYIFNWIKFENTKFTSCVAASHGGAIDISNGDNVLYLGASLNIEGCTFTDCLANGNRGGALRMVVDSSTARNLNITNSGFSDCSAGSLGGAVSIQGSIGNISISGYKTDSNGNFTFRNCSNGTDNFGGAFLVDCDSGMGNITIYNAVFTGNTSSARGAGVALLCPTVGNISIESSVFSNNTAGTIGGGFYVGIRSSAAGSITAGDVSVHGSTFSNNKANNGVGGCLSFTDGTYKSFLIDECSFSNSFSANFGGAINIKSASEDASHLAKFPLKVTGNVTITDCSFSNCVSGGLSPEPYDHDNNAATANKTTWDHDGDPSTAEITRLNGTGGGGAIALGGEITGTVTIASTGTSYADIDSYPASFTNCYTWNNGGAIYFTGSMKTTKVDMKFIRFAGCRSRDAGNAVYIAGAIIDDLLMQTCTVRDCKYFTPDFTIDIPGTAYDSLGTATYVSYDASGTFRCVGDTTCRAEINNCTFTGNESFSNGGAVYWNANNIRTGAGGTTITPSLKIKYTMLDGNHAERDGGGLYVEATVQVIASVFKNNTATFRGGAIAQQVYNNETRKLGAGEATNLSLDANTFVYENQSGTHGGGISITVSTTSSVDDGTNLIYPVKFSLGGAKVYNNKALGNGGGIYYATTTYENALEQREVDNFQKEILIDNGLIFGNIAGYDDPDDGVAAIGGSGGGIYMSSNQINTGTGTGYSKVSITGGYVCDNHAKLGNGGGVFLNGTNALCIMSGGIIGETTDGQASPNTAIHGTVNGVTSGGNGGGIAVFDGARIEMTGGEVLNNIATQAGGGVAVHKNSTMYMLQGDVKNNLANFGGGISINNCPDKDGETDITKKYGMYFANGTVSDNLALASGTVYGVTISNASNLAYGGGICLADNATMRFDDGKIENNIAASTMSGSTYTYAAGAEGGGIAVCQSSTMNVYGGVIDTNHAYEGGGIVVRGGSTLNMRTSETDATKVGVIQNNVADHYGGGMYGYGATVNIFDGSIITNKAKRSGGAYFDNSSNVLIDGGKVDNNTATGTVGGLYFHSATVTINDGSISGNKSPGVAGGIAVDGACTITINGGSICDNTATQGGGLWMQNNSGAPKVTIYGGTISRNSASDSGGGIFIHGNIKEGTELKVYGGTISDNTCNIRGGGINADSWATVQVSKYTNPTTGEVTYPVITRNTGGIGGGICVCYGSQLTVNEGYITFNEAKGACTKTTANISVNSLKGVGGGIAVGDGYTAAKPAKFTLEGKEMAIYGNTAEFAADDVYSNNIKTVLTIPKVIDMNMAGYKFMPEAWFEDYAKNDTAYTSGTNLGSDDGITNGNVFRYRGAISTNRFMIKDSDLATLVNASNRYVCMTLGIPSAVNDTVVSDFGLNMSVDVIANDNILSVAEITTAGILSLDAPEISEANKVYDHDGIIYGDLDSNFKLENRVVEDLKYGRATLDTQTGEILYEMGTNNLIMTEEEVFYYTVKHTGPKGGSYYYYGQVTVVPATSIYYEDNCGGIEYINCTATDGTYGTWKDATLMEGFEGSATDLSEFTQGQDRPGSAMNSDIDNDQVYGYDKEYNKGNNNKFSMGSAKWVRVDEDHDATARFTFTGTGFDIISLCSNNTGLVMVDLYEGATIPAKTYDSDEYKTTIMVDTFYGCTVKCYKCTYTYTNGQWNGVKEEIQQSQMGISDPTISEPKEGDVVIQYLTEIEPDDEAGPTYQVPIVKQRDLPYGTYTAEIYVAYSPWMEGDRHSGNYCDFYLDAIRIYDPANNGANSQTIRDSYLADGEGWPVYQELRNLFITQEELTSKPTSGAVFIDGCNYNVGTYKYFGANNEVYLGTNDSIGFKLNELKYMEGFESSDFDTSATSIVDKVHLGVKSLSGKGTVTITDGTTTLTLNPRSTEMFYDITSMMNKTVTIRNTGGTIISLTTVKITHTQEPVNASGYSARILTVDEDTVQEVLEQTSSIMVEPTDPALVLKYPTLTFEGEINYNIYFEAQGMDGLHPDRFGLAVFSTKDAEGTVGTADAVLSGAVQDGELLVVSTEGIPAKKLGDTMYFKVYAMLEDGSLIYSPVFGYSAQNYAKSVLNSATATVKQKTLVVAMLNYGAAAQTYFGYNTEALMNSIITEDQQALVSGFSADSLNAVVPAEEAKCGSFASNGGFTNAYPTVSFEGAFQIQYYFLPANLPDGEVNFCFWSQDTYESCETLTTENADLMVPMTVENGEYMGISPEVAAKDLDKTLYVAAYYEADGVTYSSGVLAYSLAKYCKTHAANAMSNMNAFASAAAIYGCAAKNYFAQ